MFFCYKQKTKNKKLSEVKKYIFYPTMISKDSKASNI